MDQRKDNFKRIAESRTNKIIDLIQLLGNLKNKSFYDYTDDQIAQIFEIIENELQTQKKLFFEKENKTTKFKLKWGVLCLINGDFLVTTLQMKLD